MRVRPLTLLTATAAVTLLVAAGSEALVQAKVYSLPINAPVRVIPQRPAPAPPQSAALMLEAATPPQEPQPPQALPGAGSAPLQARVQQATEEAAASGAALSVAILDRRTHQLVSNGNGQVVGTASVAKLFIADDLLLHQAEGKAALSAEDRQALDIMLQSSDDGAAERFWGRAAGPPSSPRWPPATAWRPPPRPATGAGGTR